MLLTEMLVWRRYLLTDYDWTPLSRNLCWLTCFRTQLCMNEHIEDFLLSAKHSSLLNEVVFIFYWMQNCGKSWTDEPACPRYCPCWEWPLCYDPLRFSLWDSIGLTPSPRSGDLPILEDSSMAIQFKLIARFRFHVLLNCGPLGLRLDQLLPRSENAC